MTSLKEPLGKKKQPQNATSVRCGLSSSSLQLQGQQNRNQKWKLTLQFAELQPKFCSGLLWERALTGKGWDLLKWDAWFRWLNLRPHCTSPSSRSYPFSLSDKADLALQQNICSWCPHWQPSLLATYSRVRFQHVPWRGTKSDPETADFRTKIIVICFLIFIARNLRNIRGKDTRSERKEDNLRLGQIDQYGF